MLLSPPNFGVPPGLPYFVLEPQDMEVGAATPFNLSCGARGPPNPIQLRWLRDGTPLPDPPPGDDDGDPPSTLLVPGKGRGGGKCWEGNGGVGGHLWGEWGGIYGAGRG